jgi:hypothetical protein
VILFTKLKICLVFDQKWAGLRFGRFFSQTRLVKTAYLGANIVFNRTQAPGKEEEAEVVGWRPCVAHLPVGEEDVAVAEVDVVVPQVAVHQRLQVLELIFRAQFSAIFYQFSALKIGVFLLKINAIVVVPDTKQP